MREILFRGISEVTDEWVYGYLVKTRIKGNEYFSIVPYDDLAKTLTEKRWFQVIPETVGQFTGLTEKNGKKIFEGDVVELNIKGHTTICKVAWADNVAQFQLWQTNTIPHTPTALNFGNYDCEIIGNIYDNPELLKGGAE